jgi:uncharacterized pyridoxamine 5'-phosphate oxidase family protein
MFDYAAFFKENPVGVFATAADGDQVKTRVFQYLFTENDRVYFCTGAGKAVYAQLQQRPAASFCSFSPNYAKVVSVNGKVIFTDDLELKKRILDGNPAIRGIYKTHENPDFKVLYIDVEAVETFSSAEGPKKYRLK